MKEYENMRNVRGRSRWRLKGRWSARERERKGGGRDWLAGEQQPLGRRVETSFAQSQQKATILSH